MWYTDLSMPKVTLLWDVMKEWVTSLLWVLHGTSRTSLYWKKQEINGWTKRNSVSVSGRVDVLPAVLLFIWAVSAGNRDMATLSLFSFLFFMGVLSLAFIYIWKEGGLEWR